MKPAAEMKWRKEPHRKIWIGRGKHTVAVISINPDGTYKIHTTASEITICGNVNNTLAQAKAFAADAEWAAQVNQADNPTESNACPPPPQHPNHPSASPPSAGP